MVSWSPIQAAAHEARVAAGKSKPSATADAVRETGRGGLHEKIIYHCNAQWPRWKFRHARTDIPTTEETGVEDFTLFLPGNRTLHVECKSKTGKKSPKQRIWAYEMKLLGHTVHEVRSFERFLELVK